MKELLDLYISQVEPIRAKAAGIPAQLLDYKPFDDAWTIREHIIHLADNELSAFLRIKLSIAEPGTTVVVLDEEKWVKAMDASKLDLADYIDLFAMIRKIIYAYLAEAGDDRQEAAYFTHPERGRMSLKSYLELITRHVNTHIDYIDRNIKLFEGK